MAAPQCCAPIQSIYVNYGCSFEGHATAPDIILRHTEIFSQAAAVIVTDKFFSGLWFALEICAIRQVFKFDGCHAHCTSSQIMRDCMGCPTQNDRDTDTIIALRIG